MKVFKFKHIIFVDINEVDPEEIGDNDLESCADALNIPSRGYCCENCTFFSVCVDHRRFVGMSAETLKGNVLV